MDAKTGRKNKLPSRNATKGSQCAVIADSVALVAEGEIEAEKTTMEMRPAASEGNKRKAQWRPRENEYGPGYLWKYAQQVAAAVNGAVTCPRETGEKTCYANT